MTAISIITFPNVTAANHLSWSYSSLSLLQKQLFIEVRRILFPFKIPYKTFFYSWKFHFHIFCILHFSFIWMLSIASSRSVQVWFDANTWMNHPVAEIEWLITDLNQSYTSSSRYLHFFIGTDIVPHFPGDWNRNSAIRSTVLSLFPSFCSEATCILSRSTSLFSF